MKPRVFFFHLLLVAPAWLHAVGPASFESISAIPAAVGESVACPDEQPGCPEHKLLKVDAVVWGLPMKAGAPVSEADGERSGTLSRDVEIDGVKFRGGTVVTLSSTRLVQGTLAAPRRLSGVSLPAGTEVTFHPTTGRLTMAVLGAPLTVGGRRHAKGAAIMFINGRPVEAVPSGDR